LTKASKSSSNFLDLKLISRREFAKYLDCEEDSLRRFFVEHEIPTRKICGQVMFLMSDLLAQVPAEVRFSQARSESVAKNNPRAKARAST